MNRMNESLKIGELAARSDVSRDAIRFYEREGLLPHPQRTAARYRVYGNADVGRVLFIRQAQAIGLTLDDIRELARLETLRTPGECRRVAALLRERMDAVDRKLRELKAFRLRLAESLHCCETAESDACPVVLDLTRRKAPRKGASRR